VFTGCVLVLLVPKFKAGAFARLVRGFYWVPAEKPNPVGGFDKKFGYEEKPVAGFV